MSSVVEYILNLRDNMSPAIQGATQHIKGMESQLQSMGGIASKMGAVLGVSFAAFQGFEWVKGGVEKFHELEQQTAKLEANLKSTSESAGVSMNDLKGWAGGLSSHIQASKIDIMDMQSQLLTFPAISKDVFQSSMGLVADIAKQTGHGLSETAIMFGKAVTSPAEGLEKMKRYGVMFTDSEKEKIKALQESGKLLEAQKFMIEAIAHSGYAGVATAMFNADPIARFNKLMGGAQTAIGEVAMTALKTLIPYMEKFAGWVKSLAVEMVKFKDVLIPLAIGLGVAGLTGVIYSLTTATIAWAGALWATGIPEIVIGITALVAGIVALYEHFKLAREIITGVWNVIKSIASSIWEVFKDLYEIINGIANFIRNGSLDGIRKGFTDLVGDVSSAGKNAGKAWADGMSEGANSWQKDQQYKIDETAAKQIVKLTELGKISESASMNAISNLTAKLEGQVKNHLLTNESKEKILSLLPSKQGKAGKNGTVTNTDNQPAPKTKAEGQKNINITISYNAPLIKDFTISTTNVKEGLGKLKDMVAEILTNATHDALMVADY